MYKIIEEFGAWKIGDLVGVKSIVWNPEQKQFFCRVERFGAPERAEINLNEYDQIPKSNLELVSCALRIRTIRGDGNCLYRAVAQFLYNDSNKYQSIKNQIFVYIQTHSETFEQRIMDEFKESVQHYCFRMMRIGEWGGAIELKAIAEFYHLYIEVYDESLSKLLVCEGPEVPEKSYVLREEMILRLQFDPNPGHYNLLWLTPMVVKRKNHKLLKGYYTHPCSHSIIGVLQYDNGGRVEGEFRKKADFFEACGHCVKYNVRNFKVSSGNYVYGKKDGRWTFYNYDEHSGNTLGYSDYKNGIPLKANWTTLYSEDGVKLYEGHFNYSNRKGHGIGTLFMSNGNSVRGEWINGKLIGDVIEYNSKGVKIFEGSTLNESRHGFGKEFFSDSEDEVIKYIGDFENNLWHGNGVQYNRDGKIQHEGQFQNGFPHNEGMEDNSECFPHNPGVIENDVVYPFTPKVIELNEKRLFNSMAAEISDKSGDDSYISRLTKKCIVWLRPRKKSYIASMFRYIIRTIFKNRAHVFTDLEMESLTKSFNKNRKWINVKSFFFSSEKNAYGKILSEIFVNDGIQSFPCYTISEEIRQIFFDEFDKYEQKLSGTLQNDTPLLPTTVPTDLDANIQSSAKVLTSLKRQQLPSLDEVQILDDWVPCEVISSGDMYSIIRKFESDDNLEVHNSRLRSRASEKTNWTYEPECFTGYDKRSKTIRVRWRGFEDADTWERRKKLCKDVPDMVLDFFNLSSR